MYLHQVDQEGKGEDLYSNFGYTTPSVCLVITLEVPTVIVRNIIIMPPVRK